MYPETDLRKRKEILPLFAPPIIVNKLSFIVIDYTLQQETLTNLTVKL